jgi:hypothetical protein
LEFVDDQLPAMLRKIYAAFAQDFAHFQHDPNNLSLARLDMCATLPLRSWAKIRKKITQLRRKDFTVTKPQAPLVQHETIAQHREQYLEQGITRDAEGEVR